MQTNLIIGNKNYSSWSLRVWLILKQADIHFNEILLKLDTDDFENRIGDYSPSRTVPVLQHNHHVIWDSLAIAEFLNESFPEKQLWPESQDARIEARAVSAEMHSGFFALREQMPMNCRATMRTVEQQAKLQQNIERVLEIWNKARQKFKNQGPFLFGSFSIADAMYAPVVFRFNTYQVAVSGLAKEYMQTMLDLPAMQEWLADAQAEPEYIEHEEVGLQD